MLLRLVKLVCISPRRLLCFLLAAEDWSPHHHVESDTSDNLALSQASASCVCLGEVLAEVALHLHTLCAESFTVRRSEAFCGGRAPAAAPRSRVPERVLMLSLFQQSGPVKIFHTAEKRNQCF